MLEAYVSEIGYLAMVFGSIMSSVNFVQAHKIWKRKSSADVSLIVWAASVPGYLFWILYGISLNAFAITFANIIALASAITIIISWFYFRK